MGMFKNQQVERLMEYDFIQEFNKLRTAGKAYSVPEGYCMPGCTKPHEHWFPSGGELV